VLAAEFLSIELGFLKIFPENGFCVSGILAKVRTFFRDFAIVVNQIASLHDETHTHWIPYVEPPPRGIRFAIPLPS
jgi:hypothetical protein